VSVKFIHNKYLLPCVAFWEYSLHNYCCCCCCCNRISNNCTMSLDVVAVIYRSMVVSPFVMEAYRLLGRGWCFPLKKSANGCIPLTWTVHAQQKSSWYCSVGLKWFCGTVVVRDNTSSHGNTTDNDGDGVVSVDSHARSCVAVTSPFCTPTYITATKIHFLICKFI